MEQEPNSKPNSSNNSGKRPVQTYLAIGDVESTLLEVDLVTFREKNQEMRYLGLAFTGTNPKSGEPQEAFINIDNEEAFNIIKNFFAQLEWNS